MNALLNNYANPEELKQLVAVFSALAQGGAKPGLSVKIPIRAGNASRNRFIASVLRASNDLPLAPNQESARKCVAHFALTISQTLEEDQAATIAFHVAEALQDEIGFTFTAPSKKKAVDNFVAALATGQESQLLQLMRSIWK